MTPAITVDLPAVYHPPGALLIACHGEEPAGCHAHHHAAQHGMTRLILDVLPTRSSVISFYRRLGYTETEPFATESPVPMIYAHSRAGYRSSPGRRL